MAVAITPVAGANYVAGNKRKRILTLTFSGNYATGGEALTAANLGLRKVESVQFQGPARSTDLVTAVVCSYNHATGKVVFYESGASGAALAEKANTEPYPTGCNVRVEATGY